MYIGREVYFFVFILMFLFFSIIEFICFKVSCVVFGISYFIKVKFWIRGYVVRLGEFGVGSGRVD